MCSVSTPKPDQSAVDAANKKPQYLRNPWLDGLAIQGGASSGRDSLVIAPGTQPPTETAPIRSVAPRWNPPNPNLGIGGGGGGNGGLGIHRPGMGPRVL